jgi:hypothetical protein
MLCTVALLGFAPRVEATCLAVCPYGSFPYPQYGCAGGGGFLVTSWLVQLFEDDITVHPYPIGMIPILTGTVDCDNSTFSATSSGSGDCTALYTLTGSITSPSQWTGTFSVQYKGGPPCLDCIDQIFEVSGSCVTDAPTPGNAVLGSIVASPNPAQASTTLRFDSTGDAAITLEVFDVTGRLLRTLVDHVVLPRGVHEMPWSAEPGSSTASTVHFARLTAGEHVEIIKFVVLH